MAQKVKIAGALFSDVPSISVPDDNDVYHSFVDISDTTAVAGDVASNKYFYTSSGVKTSGSATTAQATVSGTTLTLTDGFPVSTGLSNIISGTITTPSESGTSEITIPYSGSGYPIAMVIYPTGGFESFVLPSSLNATIAWLMFKYDTETAPTYTGSDSENNRAVSANIKANYGGVMSASENNNLYPYSQSASASGVNTMPGVAFKSATTFAYSYTDNGPTFKTGNEYTYIVVYSS